MWGRGSWVKVAPKGSYIFHLWKSIGTHTKYGPISDTRSTKKLIPNVIIVPILETRQLGPTNNNSTSRELHGWLWQQTRGCQSLWRVLPVLEDSEIRKRLLRAWNLLEFQTMFGSGIETLCDNDKLPPDGTYQPPEDSPITSISQQTLRLELVH